MRAAVLAVMAIATLSAIEVAPAQAQRYPDYPYCLRTFYDSDDCSYTSYQQCQWTASGTGQYCFANPALAYYAQPASIDGPAPRYHHRHHHARYMSDY
jgi:hypothetical protein